MTSSKKRRMSMLDSLAAAGAPAPAGVPQMMPGNRALRSARDAVDAHHVWELDPETITDSRMADRLDPADVSDLRDAIETNGQTVPILVRRDPETADRYLLVYGRRRLEAIRQSDKVDKVRALVATLDESSALTAQISENMARRDLSFIEKALFSQELVESGYGNQSQVADVLTVTKSSVSMAIAIAETIGRDLIAAIGAAHGIGRPRWDALSRAIAETGVSRERLIKIADKVHSDALVANVIEDGHADDPSVLAFDAVLDAVGERPPRKRPKPTGPTHPARPLSVAGRQQGMVRRTDKTVTLALNNGPFADWVEEEAQDLITDLHARWLQRRED